VGVSTVGGVDELIVEDDGGGRKQAPVGRRRRTRWTRVRALVDDLPFARIMANDEQAPPAPGPSAPRPSLGPPVSPDWLTEPGSKKWLHMQAALRLSIQRVSHKWT
jgi:hypothetical protein